MVEAFDKADVPIDVLSGVSGGALVGAFYCKLGKPGLHECLDFGPQFQLCVFGSMTDSSCIEWLVDRELDATRIDEIERRFVPVAAALRQKYKPQAHAILGGTFGEAARVSGAAPMLFAPTEKGDVRYSDGAAASMVPARMLPFYGADAVYALNSIPGPAKGNLFGWIPVLGDFLYRRTPLGRMSDVLVNYAYLLQRTSEDAAVDADEFVAADAQEWPLIESSMFFMAKRIARRGAADATWQAGIQRCVDHWTKFKSS
jgi:predicted acylesterase/phospholipase RssA